MPIVSCFDTSYIIRDLIQYRKSITRCTIYDVHYSMLDLRSSCFAHRLSKYIGIWKGYTAKRQPPTESTLT